MKAAKQARRAQPKRAVRPPAGLLADFVQLVRSTAWRELRAFLGASPVWMMDHAESAQLFVDNSARALAESTGFEMYLIEPVATRESEGRAVVRGQARASWRGEDGCANQLGVGLVLELAAGARGTWAPSGLSLSNGMRVHAGCGPGDYFPRLLLDWVNLDQQFDAPGFGRVDLLSHWPFPDGSVAAVYSEDFLEHFDQREQLIFLGEAFRVLQPGGVLRTVCPALSEDLVRRRLFPAWPQTGIRAADLSVEWPEWGHRLLPTYEYLARVLELVGFVDVRRHAKHGSDIPGFPGDKRPLSDRREADELYVEATRPMPSVAG